MVLKDANRKYALIKTLKKNTKVDLELVANSPCVSGSSFCHGHYLELSHSVKFPFPVFLMQNCMLSRLKDPVDYFLKRATWIRPEDLAKFDRAGVDIYKILSRECTTRDLLVRAKAYLSGKYKGNLLSILGRGGFEFAYLDNQQLDGFIDRFVKTKCSRECSNCNYCEQIATRCLKTSGKKKIRLAIREYEETIDYYFSSK